MSRAFFLTGLLVCAVPAQPAEQPSQNCSDVTGKVISLRGKVVKVHDHMDPSTDFGNDLVLDPMEDVLVLQLSRPLCRFDNASTDRPVVQSDVTTIELTPTTALEWKEILKHVGRAKTIEGTLSENVWWRYEATLKLDVTKIR